eukprot:CFRG1585T1
MLHPETISATSNSRPSSALSNNNRSATASPTVNQPSLSGQQKRKQTSGSVTPNPGSFSAPFPLSTPKNVAMKKKNNTDKKDDNKDNIPTTNKKRKKKKQSRADRTLPAKISPITVNSIPYKRLCVFERRLDALIMRKRFEVQDHLKRPHRSKRTLRLFVSSKATAPTEMERGSWALRVEGKLLDDTANKDRRRKFSSFFSTIFVELSKEEYGDQHMIEWHRPADLADIDGIEVRRYGTANTIAKIILKRDNQPAIFKLDTPLAKLLGIHSGTRSFIITALWQYIQKAKLQDKLDNTKIVNDKYLQQIFGRPEMEFTSIGALIKPFLLPMEPLQLEYEIRPGDGEGKDLVVDVEVSTEDFLQRQEAFNFLLNSVDAQQITQYDHQISNKIEQLQKAMVKRNFMKGFSVDPVGFTQKWIASQYRDYKTANNLRGDPEEERSASFYYKPWAEEATWKYLSERSTSKRTELEEEVHALKQS